MEYFNWTELIGDAYILIDRQQSTFVPSHGFRIRFLASQLSLWSMSMDGDRRGKVYSECVVMYDKLAVLQFGFQ